MLRLILQYLAETLPTDQFYLVAFVFVLVMALIAVICLICFAT
jgi:hypothetical protein